MSESLGVRETAIAYVAAVLSGPLATAGLPATDTVGALKEPLDATERGMAFCLIPDEDDIARQLAFNAVAVYQVWLRLADEVAGRFRITTSRGASYALDQVLPGFEKRIESARLRAVALAGVDAVIGGPAAGSAGTGEVIGAITLDWSSGSTWDEEYAQW